MNLTQNTTIKQENFAQQAENPCLHCTQSLLPFDKTKKTDVQSDLFPQSITPYLSSDNKDCFQEIRDSRSRIVNIIFNGKNYILKHLLSPNHDTDAEDQKKPEKHLFSNEIKALHLLKNQHKNITWILQEYTNPVPAILLDDYSSSDLLSYLRNNIKNDIEFSFNFLLQITDGLSFLHNSGIMHGNINPKNIILCNENGKTRFKIINFNSCFFTSKDKKELLHFVEHKTGEIPYIAPEGHHIPFYTNDSFDTYALSMIVKIYRLNHPQSHRDPTKTTQMQTVIQTTTQQASKKFFQNRLHSYEWHVQLSSLLSGDTQNVEEKISQKQIFPESIVEFMDQKNPQYDAVLWQSDVSRVIIITFNNTKYVLKHPVYLIKNTEDNILSIKKSEQNDYLFNEIDVFSILNEKSQHINIISLLKAYNEPVPAILLPYYPSQTLYYYMQDSKNITIPLVHDLILQITNGLKFIHQNKIIHGDIKPENIVIHQKNGKINFKIIDFGHSFIVPSHNSSTLYLIKQSLGTPPYQANEIQDYQKSGYFFTNYTFDSFSLGEIISLHFIPYLQPYDESEDSILSIIIDTTKSSCNFNALTRLDAKKWHNILSLIK